MIIYYILFSHWVADFIFQTDKMAQNKSTSWPWLSSHVLTYSVFMLPYGPIYALVNGAAHFVTDAITSRVTSYLWRQEKRHDFFVVIGFDQLLHIVVLIATIPLMGWDFKW